MRLLRLFLVVVLVLALLAVVLSAVAPTTLTLSRKIFIQAPLDTVWNYVSTLRAMDLWSPWNALDTTMKKNYYGTDGSVGASMHWVGNKQAGEGRQTITAIEPRHRIDVHVQFLKPFSSEANSYIQVDDSGAGTEVTWGFTSITPRPFNIIYIFMDMEKLIGQDFEKGLRRLKELTEPKHVSAPS
ncbi:MAG: SRPBCC family protein [Chitinophagales bacterium]|nr:SRPBCC family protein [Chitinophagales bacterium]MDW8427193.1 SRPBCC family protein [Chitinophagales bacterium]